MSDHYALRSLADATVRRIERLENGLLVCVSEREGCGNAAKCGHRRWENLECSCAVKARQYLPSSERNK